MRVSHIALAAALAVTSLSTAAFAQTGEKAATAAVSTMAQAPAGATSILRLYKQSVYDGSDARIGEVDDILMTNDGRAVALVIGVGGFLGLGETHVVVPLQAVAVTMPNDKPKLVMKATKEQLQKAAHFRYDSTKLVWMPRDRK
jgi:hypothetical protein